jgi:microcystin-dependent protein
VFPSGRVYPDDQMPLLGQISVFPKNPSGREYSHEELLPCDGRLLEFRSYGALGNLLGTTFGGDGESTFGMPDIPPPGPGLFFGMCANGAYPQLVPYPAEVPG